MAISTDEFELLRLARLMGGVVKVKDILNMLKDHKVDLDALLTYLKSVNFKIPSPIESKITDLERRVSVLETTNEVLSFILNVIKIKFPEVTIPEKLQKYVQPYTEIKTEITAAEESKDQIVAIFRSKPEGLEFLLKNNAWGYVRLPRKKIHYIAIHTTKPKQILYYGKVREIIPQDKHPTLAREEEKGKYIISLDWVKQLENPIHGPGSRGMVYTTLDKLLHAKTTKDL